MKTPCEPKTLTEALAQLSPTSDAELTISQQYAGDAVAGQLAARVADVLASNNLVNNKGQLIYPKSCDLPPLP